MAKNKGTETLKKITAEAKRIRRKSPGKKWQTCIKEASRKIRKR